MRSFLDRLIKVGDALSQLGNVLLLPDIHDTDANESISGRCYRRRWTWARKAVDALLWFNPDHCRRAYEADLAKARRLLGL